jgi:hypothetical protein
VTVTTEYVETDCRVFRVDTVSLRPGHARRRVRLESGKQPTPAEWVAIRLLVACGDREGR